MNTAINYFKAAVFGSVGIMITLIVMSALIHYASRLPAPVGTTIAKAGTLTSPAGWGN